MTATTQPSTDVVATAQALVKKNASVDELLRHLLPEPTPAPSDEVPLPQLRTITPEVRAALAKLPKVFGGVIPDTRRKLAPEEISRLLDERRVGETIAKAWAARKADITTTIHNHLNVEAEETGLAVEATLRTKEGHYILSGEAQGNADDRQCFRREPRKGTCTVNDAKLRALDEAGEIDHDDYLAITSQVRVFDEAKYQIALRKKPELVRLLTKIGERGAGTAAIVPRNV